MKLIIYLLVAVVVVVNSVCGYGVINNFERTNEVDDECVLDGSENHTKIVTLVRRQQSCVDPSPAFLRQLITATTLDAHRQIFREVCNKVPQTRECVAAVQPLADACLTDAEMSMFTVFKEIVNVGIDELCYQNGERLAVLFGSELKAFTLGNARRLTSCFHAMIATATFDDKHTTDYAAFSVVRYESFKSVKGCIGNIARSQNVQMESFEYIINKLIEKSKCITRDTGDLVLCKDMQSN